jgi:hypothetical protein
LTVEKGPMKLRLLLACRCRCDAGDPLPAGGSPEGKRLRASGAPHLSGRRALQGVAGHRPNAVARSWSARDRGSPWCHARERVPRRGFVASRQPIADPGPPANRRGGRCFRPGFTYKILIWNSCDFRELDSLNYQTDRVSTTLPKWRSLRHSPTKLSLKAQ